MDEERTERAVYNAMKRHEQDTTGRAMLVLGLAVLFVFGTLAWLRIREYLGL